MTIPHTQPAGCDLDSQELGAIKEAAKFAWAYGKEELHATLEKIVARAAQAPQGDTRQGADREMFELARADQSPVAISNAELAAFHRFCDCCEDFGAGGHDVPKAMMSQLVRIGLVRPAGPGRHETTKFGDWLRDLATPAAHTCTPADERTTVDAIVRDVCELDYSSGFDEEKMLVVTVDDLKLICERHALAAQGAGTAPVAVSQAVDVCTPCQGTGLVQHYLGGKTVCLDCSTRPAPVSTAAATTASAHPGCGHCNNSLFAGTRCDCGKVFSRAADGQQGASRAALLNEVADVLAEQNWRGDLVEQLRDAALARAPLPAQADGQAVDDARLEVFIDWYLRGGEYAEINPNGHMVRTTRADILAWLDRSIAAKRGGATDA